MIQTFGGDDDPDNDRDFILGGDDDPDNDRDFILGGDEDPDHDRDFILGGDGDPDHRSEDGLDGNEEEELKQIMADYPGKFDRRGPKVGVFRPKFGLSPAKQQKHDK